MRFRSIVSVALLASAPLVACGVDTIPEGEKATPAGDGPLVVFDLTRRPLPEIPFPNDIATFADPTSRTGLRVNVSTVATTRLERAARDGFNDLEGWGTFAPITVAFQRGAGDAPLDAAIDLANVASRMIGDGYDFSDDPFYVVNLTTGVPVILDGGNGNFPPTIVDPTLYWPNDPRLSAQNILFETAEEGAGIASYAPALDTDFDGVLDHPNTRTLPLGGIAGVDDVMTWYERQTDTLIMRPVLPLEEKTEYAVVLTDRLTDARGRPVRSPFADIHHAQQKNAAIAIAGAINDPTHAAYFGDIAGTGLDHVAFVWSFTTEPVYEDMRILRDGLHGHGPFASLATDFPPTTNAYQAIGLARQGADEPADWQSTPSCAPVAAHPYIVKVADAENTISQLLTTVLGLNGPQSARLLESLQNIDHFVIGYYKTPYFMGDPTHEDPDGRFQLDYRAGTGNISSDVVPYWLAVPRATAHAKQPFPTTVWAHGSTLHADEIIVRAGYFAKQGVAMLGIDMPGHGLYLDAGTTATAEILLRETCMVSWLDGITSGRDYDLNGDGVPDSGGLLWTAHIFHSRDNIRQAVMDEMQATRMLRAFDGKTLSLQDYDGDGKPNLAGDFDADGVPDVGGPGVPLYTSGNSFGGILAMVHGAVDPEISAGASISGGGGLTDVATRSALVPNSVMEQVFSPLVVSVPATERSPTGLGGTACSNGQRSVRFVLNDLTNSAEMEIACLSTSEVDQGMTVVLTNVTTQETRCARTSADGRFRIPVPATIGDKLDIQIYNAPDVVKSYDGCEVTSGAPPGRRINTFEQAPTLSTAVADDLKSCDGSLSDDGLNTGGACQVFQGNYYPVGSDLIAPQEGLGLLRQSPEFRKFMQLTQTAIEGSDPVNFAPYYMLRARPEYDGTPGAPKPFVAFSTVGDPDVPLASGHSFARALGALPFLPPSFLAKYPEYAEHVTPDALYQTWGDTPNDVLIENHVVEGLARLGRTHAGPACNVNWVSSATCAAQSVSSDTCAHTLFDADWLAEGADLYDAPHLPVPTRLARSAADRVVDAASLTRAWQPRILGAPGSADGGWQPGPPLVGMVTAYNAPLGQHVWVNADPCKAFDDAVYYDHLLIRFLATGGTDLYFLSHPATHKCLATEACDFFPSP